MSWYSRGAERWEPGFQASHQQYLNKIDVLVAQAAAVPVTGFARRQSTQPSVLLPRNNISAHHPNEFSARIGNGSLSSDWKTLLARYSRASIGIGAVAAIPLPSKKTQIRYPFPWESYPSPNESNTLTAWIRREHEIERACQTCHPCEEKHATIPVQNTGQQLAKFVEKKQDMHEPSIWRARARIETKWPEEKGVESIFEEKKFQSFASAPDVTPFQFSGGTAESPVFACRERDMIDEMGPKFNLESTIAAVAIPFPPVAATDVAAPAIPIMSMEQQQVQQQVQQENVINTEKENKSDTKAASVEKAANAVAKPEESVPRLMPIGGIPLPPTTERVMVHARRRLQRPNNFKIIREGDSDSSAASTPKAARAIPKTYTKPKDFSGFEIVWEEE